MKPSRSTLGEPFYGAGGYGWRENRRRRARCRLARLLATAVVLGLAAGFLLALVS